jgi:hypothetical protein
MIITERSEDCAANEPANDIEANTKTAIRKNRRAE